MKNSILLSLCILLIVGCQNTNNITKPSASIPKDAIIVRQEIENIERFQQFLNNIAESKEDRVTIVQYTIEGDPILDTLEYVGEVLKYSHDTRQDEYGEKTVTAATCTTISVKEDNEGATYTVQGCNNQNINTTILVIPK
ncbi:DUF4362 domain-containing protein [Lysinibacillus louembei]|uniref:DUF4362 domain-containing protein n=1 Tax=Lysinibacillus louembei TaxID=1470088 RepID=A0ABZ0RZ67_9BACI|nr:DUF4362 domain-containing protein [Lysinibacillus louembei]WPK13528.1 DUF4362 domain-containing protein [Lysinibacillus louembei]